MSNSHRRRLRITEDIIQVARYRSNVGWRWVVHAAGGKEGKEDDEEEEEEKEEEEEEAERQTKKSGAKICSPMMGAMCEPSRRP